MLLWVKSFNVMHYAFLRRGENSFHYPLLKLLIFILRKEKKMDVGVARAYQYVFNLLTKQQLSLVKKRNNAEKKGEQDKVKKYSYHLNVTANSIQKLVIRNMAP